MTPQEESDLLLKSSRGEADAFGKIIKKYQYLVYALAVKMVRVPSIAQDVSQDTFVTAFAALKSLRSPEAFPSWLRTIALNTARSRLREQRRLVPLENVDALSNQSGESDVEIEIERREADAFQAEVQRCLSSLSETFRFPLLLCYIEGVSTRDAAAFLGIKEGTLRKRLHDGKKRLQREIVTMAEKTLQEFRLPRDFSKRCICGCRQSCRSEKPHISRKEVIPMPKKGNCDCGCIPSSKTVQSNPPKPQNK